MNQILLSFLCGAAFIGGAAATTCMVALVVAAKDSKGREELYGYWKSSIQKHGEQIKLLERIVDCMEKRK